MNHSTGLAFRLAGMTPAEGSASALPEPAAPVDAAARRAFAAALGLPGDPAGPQWAPHLAAFQVATGGGELDGEGAGSVVHRAVSGAAEAIVASAAEQHRAAARGLLVARTLRSDPVVNGFDRRWDRGLFVSLIGVAVAAADLLGLSRQGVATAIELTAPVSLAVRSAGRPDALTVSLKVHAAVESALLAAAGVTSPSGVLEAALTTAG